MKKYFVVILLLFINLAITNCQIQSGVPTPVDLQKFPGSDAPKNASNLFVFPVPDGRNCIEMNWCTEKCGAVLEQPWISVCDGNCICIKFAFAE